MEKKKTCDADVDMGKSRDGKRFAFIVCFTIFYPVHLPYYRRRIRDRIAKVSVPRVCSVRPLSEHNIIITDHARRYDEFTLDSNSFLRVRAAFLKIITFRKSWVLPCAVLCVQYPTRTEHPIPSPWRRFAVCRRPFKRC